MVRGANEKSVFNAQYIAVPSRVMSVQVFRSALNND
jgi:hypothetical protein